MYKKMANEQQQTSYTKASEITIGKIVRQDNKSLEKLIQNIKEKALNYENLNKLSDTYKYKITKLQGKQDETSLQQLQDLMEKLQNTESEITKTKSSIESGDLLKSIISSFVKDLNDNMTNVTDVGNVVDGNVVLANDVSISVDQAAVRGMNDWAQKLIDYHFNMVDVRKYIVGNKNPFDKLRQTKDTKADVISVIKR